MSGRAKTANDFQNRQLSRPDRIAPNAAWKVLSKKRKAIDAVEQAARKAEEESSCCVGLDGYPDRDGFVTLDASIMDHTGNIGGVAYLEHIKHPISVARMVAENKTCFACR